MNTAMVRLLLVPVAILAGVLSLAWWLALSAPVVERDVSLDVEPPYFESVPRCSGEMNDPVAASLRNQFAVNGMVRSQQLFNCPRAFDGFTVRYVGEIIGELIPRRGGVWVQVNDDAYALTDGPLLGHRNFSGFNTGVAVWLPDGTHEQLETVGRHQVRGDIIAITGTFMRADPNDGGGLTIRADTVEVMADGVLLDDPLNRRQLTVAVLLFVGAAGALTLGQLARRRR
jgi:hypothetical protein